jgi:multidrug efflux pump subunit AcrA (membrane-fusion protein)
MEHQEIRVGGKRHEAAVGSILVTAEDHASVPEADPAAAYTIQKVTRDDLSITVAVSGLLEPVSYATIYPDSNMPEYRKLQKLYVNKGDKVREGQLIAQIETSGLDLDLASAKASYESAKVKLANLKAMPTATELAQAESSLKQAQFDLVTPGDPGQQKPRRKATGRGTWTAPSGRSPSRSSLRRPPPHTTT